jgi:outer membrane lipoprotein-sorting protein
MIRNLPIRLTALMSVLAAVSVSAQQSALPPAATLVAKYSAAIGGPALMKAQQITTKGGMSMSAAGINATFEMVQLAPNKMQMMTTIPGVGNIQLGYDGTTAWSMDPMQGPRILAGKEADEVREEADPRAAARAPDLFSAMQTVADTAMAGEHCYLVKLTWKSGRETFDCYSVASGLMVGSKSVQQTAMGAIPVATEYSDYKKFGDFMMPTKATQSMMGQQQVMTIISVEVGTGAGVTIVAPPEITALIKKQ